MGMQNRKPVPINRTARIIELNARIGENSASLGYRTAG